MNIYWSIWLIGTFISSQVHIMIIARNVVLDLKSLLVTYVICFMSWPFILFCQIKVLLALKKL